MTRGKDLAKCRLYRESGNASFQAGKFSNAHLLYSISIIFAPVTLRENGDGARAGDGDELDKKSEKDAAKERSFQTGEEKGIPTIATCTYTYVRTYKSALEIV